MLRYDFFTAGLVREGKQSPQGFDLRGDGGYCYH